MLLNPTLPLLAVVSDAALLDSGSASPAALGAWLLSAAAVLSIAALLKQFARKTPLEAEFLSRKEFHDFKDKDFAELRVRVDHSFHSLTGKLDFINQRLAELASVIARLDERSRNFNPQNLRRTDHE